MALYVSNHDRRKTQLERKLRSYRSAKFGSVFLTIVSALVLLLLIVTEQTKNNELGPMYASVCFWPALAYICHLKMKLIRLELSTLP